MIDHLVYGVKDLATAVRSFEAAAGVAPSAGGRHPSWGTANALVGLGPGRYLELIGPDPQISESSRASRLSLFGLGDLDSDRLLGWAAKSSNLEEGRAAALGLGFELGEALPGHRQRPAGGDLQWRLLLRPDGKLLAGGLIPFLIDWAEGYHPADDAPGGCSLLEVWGEHPDPAAILPLLRALDTELRVQEAPRCRLRARLQTPLGILVL